VKKTLVKVIGEIPTIASSNATLCGLRYDLGLNVVFL